MILNLKRMYYKEDYTIGKLYIDGIYFCDTLEDKDRGLKDNDNILSIKAKKVFGKTAIPKGTYKVILKDRKSTRLNSSHANISYAVFCLKKNKHVDVTH